MSLYNKSITGIRWNLIVNNSIYLIGIVQMVIFARFLSEHDFGLIGIVAPLLMGLLLMSDMGFGAALIQKKTDDITPYASSILSLMLFVSIGLSSIIIFFSEEISIFYNSGELKFLMYYVALVLILKTYSIVAVSLTHRNFDFKEETIGRLIGVVISFSLSIPLAIIYKSYWALLLSHSIMPLVVIIYLNIKFKYTRVGFNFYVNKLKEIIGFALTLFIAKLIYFITRSGIGLILGKFFPIATYGQFYFAQKTSQYPQTFFGSIINSVIYSSLSSIQDDKNKFNNKFLELGLLVTFFTAPVCIYLIFYSQEIINIVFGSQWETAAIIFSYFMFFVLISTIGSIPSLAIQSKGHPKILLYANYIRIPFVVLSLYIGITLKIGIVNIALLLVLSEMVPILYLIMQMLKILNIKYFVFVKHFLLSTLIISSILPGVDYMFNVTDIVLLKLFLVLVFSALIYVIIYYLFFKHALAKILIVISDVIKIEKLRELGVKLNAK